MRVAIVGGGVVGLCCAYELQHAGADVLVLERGQLGFGASRGNTGWICPSFTYPLPAPGIMRQALLAMLHGGGPVAIRPTLDPMFARWLLGFRRSSSRERWEHGVRALLALNARTLELFDAYAESGVSFEMHKSGLLLVATTQRGLASYLSLFRALRGLGFAGEIMELEPSDAYQLEPSLSKARIVGGVHAQVDRYVRPETLTAGLAAWLRQRQVQIRERMEVARIWARNGGVVLESSTGPIEADRAVVCAGASSARLLHQLGVRMPVVGARGYSLTVAGSSTRPRQALYLAEAKVGISAYEDAVRIAGVFELGRVRDGVDPTRMRQMLSTVEPYFETWRPREEEPLLEWAGLRPMTADGLPLIGLAPALRNVYVATGHGMLGVTLGPATAALLAPLVLQGLVSPELLPFTPARAA